MSHYATAFLSTMLNEWVRVTPEDGRQYVGHLTGVSDDPDPVITVSTDPGGDVVLPWSAIARLKLCTDTKPRQENRP